VYLAPADATRLSMPAGSVDFHVSYTVLEHIPPSVLGDILREGRRVLRPEGLFVHRIDFTDHFSHSDPAISSVNFLQFSELRWAWWAGNRFMYHNRLRVDEFADIVRDAGLTTRSLETVTDPRAMEAIRNGTIRLDPRFAGKAPEVNATSSAWLVAAP
jgi:SAM-dependent methyltransferase